MQQRSASSTDDVAERLRAESKGRLNCTILHATLGTFTPAVALLLPWTTRASFPSP